MSIIGVVGGCGRTGIASMLVIGSILSTFPNLTSGTHRAQLTWAHPGLGLDNAIHAQLNNMLSIT